VDELILGPLAGSGLFAQGMHASLGRILTLTKRKSLENLNWYSQLAQPKLREPFAPGGYKDFSALRCWPVMPEFSPQK